MDNKFASDDQRFSDFKDETIFEFNNCAKKFVVNDEREEETQRTFKQNEAERDDLADRCTTLEKRLVETKAIMENRCDEKN